MTLGRDLSRGVRGLKIMTLDRDLSLFLLVKLRLGL